MSAINCCWGISQTNGISWKHDDNQFSTQNTHYLISKPSRILPERPVDLSSFMPNRSATSSMLMCHLQLPWTSNASCKKFKRAAKATTHQRMVKKIGHTLSSDIQTTIGKVYLQYDCKFWEHNLKPIFFANLFCLAVSQIGRTNHVWQTWVICCKFKRNK